MHATNKFEGAKLNPLFLTFRNNNLESSFGEYFGRYCRPFVRYGIVISLCIWCFALLQLWLADQALPEGLVFSIAAIVIPLYLTLWWLTLSEKHWRYIQIFLVLTSTVIGFQTFYLATTRFENTVLTTASLLFTCIFTFQVFPIRFLAACFSTLMVYFMATVFLLLVQPYPHQDLLCIYLSASTGWLALAYSAYIRNLNESRAFLLKQKVTSANASAEVEGYIDHVTQFFNQRYLTETIKELLSPPISSTFAVVIIDIDHMNKIMDKNKLPNSDRLVMELSGLVRDSIRQADIPVRHHPEKFTLLMKDISLNDAHTVIERMRVKTANHRFSGVKEPVTFSAGISLMGHNDLIGVTLQQSTLKADKAKASSGNRVLI